MAARGYVVPIRLSASERRAARKVACARGITVAGAFRMVMLEAAARLETALPEAESQGLRDKERV